MNKIHGSRRSKIIMNWFSSSYYAPAPYGENVKGKPHLGELIEFLNHVRSEEICSLLPAPVHFARVNGPSAKVRVFVIVTGEELHQIG